MSSDSWSEGLSYSDGWSEGLSDEVHKWIRKVLRSCPSDHWDEVHNHVESAFHEKAQQQPIVRPYSWAKTVTRNKIADHLDSAFHRRCIRLVEVDGREEGDDPEAGVSHRGGGPVPVDEPIDELIEKREQIAKALETLNALAALEPEVVEAYMLRLEGLRYREIESRLGVAISTLHKWVKRIEKHLRDPRGDY